MWPDGPAVDDPVVLDQGPRHVRDDVDRQRDHEQACRQPDGRQPEPPAQAHPAVGGGRGRRRATADVGVGRGSHGAHAESAPDVERGVGQQADQHEREAHLDRRELDRAHDDVLLRPAQGHPGEGEQDPCGGRRGDGKPHLVIRPGDGSIDGQGDRRQREADHDQDERQVPRPAAVRGHGEAHPAEEAGHADHADDEQDPAEGRADQDEDAQRADRVGGDPLGGEREAQEDAHRGHHEPEGALDAFGLQPQPREQQVGGQDEEAGVDVVHRDPALDEEHPVQQREQADEHADGAAPEEDPRQEEQDRHGERAHDRARQSPREGVRAHVQRDGLAAGPEREQRAVAGGRVVLVVVEDHRRRLERQPVVREDALPVGLDDIHRRPRAVGRPAQHVHELRRVVVDDASCPPPEAGSPRAPPARSGRGRR